MACSAPPSIISSDTPTAPTAWWPNTSRPGAHASIAVVGFALSAYPVGVERGWMTRADALQRSLAALRFFRDSDQRGTPESTGYRGFYFHFLHLDRGTRAWRCELSLIDTALLYCDYFENSRRATYVQRAYAIRNPRGFVGYGEDGWGLSAGDGPRAPRPAATHRRAPPVVLRRRGARRALRSR